MAATPLPPFDPTALADFLKSESGAAHVEISEPGLLPGGAIQENWGFTAVFDGGRLAGARNLVLRTDSTTGVPSSLSRVEEFAVLQAAFANGVTVPEPLFVCGNPDVIGRPFFVMLRIAGTAQGRQITTDPALEAELPAIAARLGRELARLQTIPPSSELEFLRFVGPAEHISGFRGYLDRHPQPRPVLEWAIRWLETHVPEEPLPVLCHRDFRTGNYMLYGAQVTGVLDWEFAGWGDPDEDIGWFCCKGWRFARLDREAGGIADRSLFYAGYEAAGGRRLDPQRVHFWEVLANVRWAIIALQQSDRHLIGGARDLTTAIIGRRATECDLELLMLLDPAGALDLRSAPTPSPSMGEGRGGGDRAEGEVAEVQARRHHPRPTLPHRGGGLSVGDLPRGAGLLALGRELLLDELLPLLPVDRHRELRLLATAMTIAERELAAGDGPALTLLAALQDFYERPASELADLASLLRRMAADLRVGAFESCAAREAAAHAILWRLTMAKLREGNPAFLAANGFGD
jgi:aminoglycoside phosphotransferase (APT) family kinase protein